MKRKILALLLSAFVLLTSACVLGAWATETGTKAPHVIDDAQVLGTDSLVSLETELRTFSEEHQFDLVAVVIQTLDGSDIQAFADDLYDYGGYGYGEDHDGCLLLVSVEDRQWHISTCGYGIDVVTDAGVDYVGAQITPSLKEGDYAGGISAYLEAVESLITGEVVPESFHYNSSHQVYTGNNPVLKLVNYLDGTTVLIAVVAAGIIAGIVVFSMRAKLKSVGFKADSRDYFVQGSLNVTASKDTFVTSHVSRTPREKSSSGGSSTHTSSSGTSHGGGGGRF